MAGNHTGYCCVYCKMKITPREQVLLKDLMRGQQDKQIAYNHDLPLHTVKYRLRSLYDKMGVMNRTQAALMAREINL